METTTPRTGQENESKKYNRMAVTGLILGLLSVFLYVIGILPILGIIFSALGLGTFNPTTQKGRWMAGVGLILSVLYTLMYLRAYGHLN